MRNSLGFGLFVAALAVGCGGGSGSHGGTDAGGLTGASDAGTGGRSDAGTVGAGSPLGTSCDVLTGGCPTGYECLRFDIDRFTTYGYCSKVCTADPECAEGYTGPGIPRCNVTIGATTKCSVGCGEQTGGDMTCPGAMICRYDGNRNGAVDTCTEGPPGSMPMTGTAYVRTFSGDDGATVQVCYDAMRYGPILDRVGGSGGAIASGYMAQTVLGEHTVAAEAYIGRNCLAAHSTDPHVTLTANHAYTLFVRGITSRSIVPIDDELAAPLPGQARLRAVNGAEDFSSAHASGLDFCIGTMAVGAGIRPVAAGAYTNVAASTATLTVREAGTGATCTGISLGSVSITVAAGASFTAFLTDTVDGRTRVALCKDATGTTPEASAMCTETLLSTGS